MKSRWLVGLMLAVFMTAGCHIETHDEGGVTYVRGQLGLGITNDTVPNLMEFDFPAMRIDVNSPVLEQAAAAAWMASNGLVKWIIGLVWG